MKTLLVIPCYYESERLPQFLPGLCEGIANSGLFIDIQLVDDGSSQEEQRALAALNQELSQRFEFLRPPLLLEKNLGKGGAVRAGWDLGNGYDMLAFVDADGAAPARETIRFLRQIGESDSSDCIHIATRDPQAGRRLERKWSRKTIARFFNTLIRMRYRINVVDTQCGLKAVPLSFFKSAREKLIHEGYSFDLELLLTAKEHGLSIKTVPIDWKEIPGSSTSLRPALTFVRQILFREI